MVICNLTFLICKFDIFFLILSANIKASLLLVLFNRMKNSSPPCLDTKSDSLASLHRILDIC